VEFEIELFGRGVPPWSPLNGNHSPINGKHSPINGKHSGTHGGVPLQFQHDFVRPFELETAPLLRVGFLESEGKAPVLLLDMHHIVTDGTSQGILTKEFMKLYRDEELEPLKIQYKDYAGWQNNRKFRESIKRQEEFWLGMFPDEVPVLGLPMDFPRPEMQSFEGDVLHFTLTERETTNLKSFVEEEGGTLHMGVLAIVNSLLSKLSGQEDIIIGTPIAARRHADLLNIVGMFVNTLAMRNFPSGDKSFKQFFTQLKERTLKVYENQEYPFEELVDKLSLNRDTGRNPLFDVMVNFLERGRADSEEGDIPSEWKTAKFDLNFIAFVENNCLNVSIEYCTRLFKEKTIKKFISYFKRLTAALTETNNREQPLAVIDILSPEEKEEILKLSTGEYETPLPDMTIHRFFEEQTERTPDHVAVVGVEPGTKVTYRQLNRK
ncbi:MAG: non-ribosomal peptide synthetase, partial [bacterium]|nr:non-ribosomal peptide synthetase [bacterium]